MKIRVYYEDSDAQGIVYHANYIKFCERARSEMFFDAGIWAFSNECQFVVSSLNAKFLKSAKLGDILDVKTSVVGLKRTNVTLLHEIYKIADINGNECNDLVFSCEVTCVCMSYLKISKIPKDISLFFKAQA
ncbi:Acyl-CoA thioesterase YbgC [Campylobacter majalis]|uniref:Acyl-CoA thioesterase YbgC n=2 Tax=Campylobacter majalis TaxID=2790656 RepID=A0ABN7K4E3_9BACT|nr:Acyl-CoA thioesterase YbgC [Campylobacter majalis]